MKKILNKIKNFIFNITATGNDIAGKCDYKRRKFQVFGIKFTCKSKEWLKHANENNRKNNLVNLKKIKNPGKRNILFVSSHFLSAGGIETRVLQYIQKICASGWNCYILSEIMKITLWRSLPILH